MTILTDKDEQILSDYLRSYKECFEAMNELIRSLAAKAIITHEDEELAKKCDSKYKNMLYHIRKWDSNYKK